MNINPNYYGYIYKTINILTKKYYIGKKEGSIEKSIEYFGSGLWLNRSINKHGKFYFKKEIIGFCSTKQELDEAEKECIQFFNSTNSIYGYNITKGGTGGDTMTNSPNRERKIKKLKSIKRTDEFKEKARKASTGRRHTEETKKKLRNRPGSMKGKHHSEETKKIISKKMKGNRHSVGRILSEEHKKKISEGNKGKIVSEETRKKMSESKKQRDREKINRYLLRIEQK